MNNLRVAWVVKTRDVSVASTRIRSLNVIQALNELGVTAELFEEPRLKHHDVLVFAKAYRTRDVELARRCRALGKKVIFDLCDNHFLMQGNTSAERKRVKGLKAMIATADTVVVSTEELKKAVIQHCPDSQSCIVVIGDAVEKILPPSPLLRRPVEFFFEFLLRVTLAWRDLHCRRRLVWFGIHGGDNAEYGMRDLNIIASAMNDLNREFPLSLTVISNSHAKFREISRSFKFPTTYMPWGGTTFFTALRRHELVLIPVTLNDFTRCKSNNRLALSLDQGLPVVASSVPAYLEFSECVILDDWKKGVATYLADPLRIARDVGRGQDIIRQKYSVDGIGRQWMGVFDKVMEKHYEGTRDAVVGPDRETALREVTRNDG